MTIETVELNAGTGGATIAVDTIGGKSYQIVKVDVGADGSEALLGNSNPIPVSDAGSTLSIDDGGGNISIDDGGNTITVDGTVAVTNAGLTALNGAISGTEVQVDVLTMPTVTVNSHAVTNAGTFATQVDGAALTALQLIDNIVAVEDAVAGSGYSGVPLLAVRQDSQTALAADGDFISPTIDSSGGLRVSIVAGAGSGGTAVADDADFTDGTTSLTPIGGVYESTPSTVTDGDIGMAGITVDRSLKVHVTGITGSQTDDAAFTPGTSIVSIVGAEFDDTTPDSVDEGDGGALRMSGNRNLYTTIRDAAGNERGANVNASNQLAVAGPVTNAGTFAVQESGSALTALQLIDNIVATEDAVAGTGYSGVPILAVRQDSQSGLAADGDFISPTIDSAGGLRVSIVAGAGTGGTSATDDAAFTAAAGSGTPMMGFATADTVDSGDVGVVAMTTARALHVAVQSIAAGSNNIGDVDVLSLPASTNTIEIVGDVAHDAGVAGNPVQVGGYASNNIEGITQVANGDLTREVHDLNGVLVTRPHTTLEEIQSVRTTNTDGNSTSLVAAAGSGVHNYLSAITIWNSSSTDGFVDLRDGTAGSVLYTVPAPQTGGAHITFPVPLKFGDNTAIAYDVSGAISTIYISAVFFQAQG